MQLQKKIRDFEEMTMKSDRDGDLCSSSMHSSTYASSASKDPSPIPIDAKAVIPNVQSDQKKGKTESEKQGKVCKYRDYSRIPASEPNRVASIYRAASAKDPPFPVKLHAMLSNPELDAVIAWLPHGRAWRILKPDILEDRVLPLYFSHNRLSSFMRQINGWGFIRVKHGPDYNSYYNELFLRGLPHLVERMRRVSVTSKFKGALSEDEPVPDFYKISEENPVPESKPSPSSLQQKVDAKASSSLDGMYTGMLGRSNEHLMNSLGTSNLPLNQHAAFMDHVSASRALHNMHDRSGMLLDHHSSGPTIGRQVFPPFPQYPGLNPVELARLDLLRSATSLQASPAAFGLPGHPAPDLSRPRYHMPPNALGSQVPLPTIESTLSGNLRSSVQANVLGNQLNPAPIDSALNDDLHSNSQANFGFLQTNRGSSASFRNDTTGQEDKAG